MRDKRENITDCDTRHGDASKNNGNKLKKEEKQRRKYLKAVSKEEKRRRKYLKAVSKIKKKARSELTNWSQYGYCLKDSMMDLGVDDGGSVLEIDGLGVSFAEFSHTIEKRHVPCLIHNLLKHWPAMKRWNSVERLMEQLKGVACKVGSDDDGYAVRMLFEHFVEYLRDPEHGKKDDSPLYIFDSTLVEKTTLKHDFIVPYIFSEDLLKYAGKSRRPPHQWMCIGGPRSGTSIHVDPLGTSAWNALVCGHKRWAMFPPGSVPEEVLKPKGVNSAARWFDVVWPKTLLDSWEYHKPLHVVQGPGDVIFVPSGWWHVVINLDFTVAVTENFCSTANFHKVFMHTRISRPKMTQRWLACLSTVRPDLARVGQQIINDDERCSDISSPSSSSTSSGGSSSSSDDENSASS
jgi:histone arginine demethylase JMJD6